MGPDDKVKTAREAISAVHSDTSVDLHTTWAALVELAELIEELVMAVKADIKYAAE